MLKEIKKKLAIIEKEQEYLEYLLEHYKNVQLAWEEIKPKVEKIFSKYNIDAFALDEEIGNHDASKLSYYEFNAYRKNYYPVDFDETFFTGDHHNYEHAFDCHLMNNRHHWQTVVVGDKRYDYVLHMIVDWEAMGKKFPDNAKQYYENNIDEIKLPDWAVKFMYEVFGLIY